MASKVTDSKARRCYNDKLQNFSNGVCFKFVISCWTTAWLSEAWLSEASSRFNIKMSADKECKILCISVTCSLKTLYL